MNFLKVTVAILILVACSSKPKLGEIGNYQVELENAKADFNVLMWEQGMKTKKEKVYASYSNNNIHFAQGVIAGKPLHGKYKEVGINGELLVVGEFNKGLKNGYWTYYNTEGRLLSDLTYKQGDTATTVKFYSENGQVETEIIPIAIKLKQEKSQAKKDKRAEKKAACKAKECKWFPKRLKKDTSAVIAPVDSLLKK